MRSGRIGVSGGLVDTVTIMPDRENAEPLGCRDLPFEGSPQVVFKPD